jgi:hypothetical protein
MTIEQEAHLKEMQDAFLKLSRKKYESGQKEHGGVFWEKPGMLSMLEEELVDAWHYVRTLRRQIDTLKDKYGPVDNFLDS